MRSCWKSVDHSQAYCPGILIKRKKLETDTHTQEEFHVEIKTDCILQIHFRAVLGSQQKGQEGTQIFGSRSQRISSMPENHQKLEEKPGTSLFLEGTNSANTLIIDNSRSSRTETIQSFSVSYLVCGTLLWEPQQINISGDIETISRPALLIAKEGRVICPTGLCQSSCNFDLNGKTFLILPRS